MHHALKQQVNRINTVRSEMVGLSHRERDYHAQEAHNSTDHGAQELRIVGHEGWFTVHTMSITYQSSNVLPHTHYD